MCVCIAAWYHLIKGEEKYLEEKVLHVSSRWSHVKRGADDLHNYIWNVSNLFQIIPAVVWIFSPIVSLLSQLEIDHRLI